MKAAVLRDPGPKKANPLTIEERPIPEPGPGEVLLQVEACGVCRTDLHITMGELKPLRDEVIPGHQIVGHVGRLGDGVDAHTITVGQRVGVSWLGGADGFLRAATEGAEGGGTGSAAVRGDHRIQEPAGGGSGARGSGGAVRVWR